MTVEYLSLFVSWVDCFLIFLASSSSSFMVASFLIQMIRRIRSSSRVEFFIFLIAWGIFFGRWEPYLQFLPIFSYLLMIQAPSSSRSLLKVITSFWHTSSHEWINDLGRPFKVDITTSAFFTSTSSCSWFERLLWLHGFYILDLHILQLVSLGHILILFFPSNSLKFWNSFACHR